MTPLLPIAPNIEAIVGDWLRDHPDIVSLGARVVGKPPATTRAPWVRITLINSSDDDVSRIEWFTESSLQLDCYAGEREATGQAEAWKLTATCRAVLKAMESRTLANAVITEVTFSGDSRIPDTTMEPARERYILTANVKAHVVPS